MKIDAVSYPEDRNDPKYATHGRRYGWLQGVAVMLKRLRSSLSSRWMVHMLYMAGEHSRPSYNCSYDVRI